MEGGRDRAKRKKMESSGSGAFFLATLILWAVSVLFEILFNGRRELLAVLWGCLFFQGANWVLRLTVAKDPLFVNTCVSLLHSSFSSLFVTLILANEWMKKGIEEMFEHKQLVDGLWSGAYSTLCFSCGYFAYDQWDMLHYRLYSGWIPSILLHHLVLLICFTLALYRNVTVNYLILSLVCELHSIFLHLRKIRRMSGVRDGKMRVVQLEWVFNWLAFFTGRLGCHVLITYKLIRDAHKFERDVVLPLALSGMAGMNLLNFFLGRDLLKAYRREQAQVHRD
ncbi:unnamed protein product [Victoria cruziana]